MNANTIGKTTQQANASKKTAYARTFVLWYENTKTGEKLTAEAGTLQHRRDRDVRVKCHAISNREFEARSYSGALDAAMNYLRTEAPQAPPADYSNAAIFIYFMDANREPVTSD